MNVYDFDGTIYDGDCTLDFWFWCFRKYPGIIKSLPKVCWCAFRFKAGFVSREYFKECFYSFLKYVPDIDSEIELFWDDAQIKIEDWYLKKRNASDIVISASPEFLISEICNRLGIRYIASKVNKEDGLLLGNNCRGQEKVKRYVEIFQDISLIDEFYSDSESDLPMAELAKSAYLVRKGCVKKWN